MTPEGIGMAEAIWPGLVLWAIAGIYDGLVRRHLRLGVDLRRWYLNVRGVVPVIWGLLCLPILYWLLRSAVGWLIGNNTACHGEFACQLNSLIQPLFSPWWVLVILAGTFIFFRAWLQNVRDPSGPWLVFFYAPGVWYDEGILLRQIEAALKDAKLPAVNENRLLNMSNWARDMIPYAKRTSPEKLQHDGVYHVEPLTRYLKGMSELDELSDSQRQVIARAIAEYYLEVLTAGEKRWPWRWKLS